MKVTRDEMKVIPGRNSSRDEITYVNGALADLSAVSAREVFIHTEFLDTVLFFFTVVHVSKICI